MHHMLRHDPTRGVARGGQRGQMPPLFFQKIQEVCQLLPTDYLPSKSRIKILNSLEMPQW